MMDEDRASLRTMQPMLDAMAAAKAAHAARLAAAAPDLLWALERIVEKLDAALVAGTTVDPRYLRGWLIMAGATVARARGESL